MTRTRGLATLLLALIGMGLLGRFRDWDEVDAVPGVGDATLRTLQGSLELR